MVQQDFRQKNVCEKVCPAKKKLGDHWGIAKFGMANLDRTENSG
jgi:hypothetical protein